MYTRSVAVIFAAVFGASAFAPARAGTPDTARHPPVTPSPVDQGHHRHHWAAQTWHPNPVPVSPLSDPEAPLDFNSPAAPAGEEYGYFCPSTGAYYPYIESCPGGWRLVPQAIGAPTPGG